MHRYSDYEEEIKREVENRAKEYYKKEYELSPMISGMSEIIEERTKNFQEEELRKRKEEFIYE